MALADGIGGGGLGVLTSAPFQACLELIDREWDAVCKSAKWKELKEDMPKLAADLALGAATRTDAQFAADFIKEARMK